MDDFSEPLELLKLAQKRFSHLIGSLPVGIIIARSDGTIESVNRSLVELFGYNEKVLVGQHLSLIFSQPPWKNSEGFSEWYGKQSQSLIEVRGLDAAKEIIPIDLSIRLFDQARSDRLLIVLQDVTDRFIANQLKNNFFQMVNHDLRSPLSAVSIFLQMVQTGNDFGSLNPLGLEKARSASLNLQRILKLTDDLLQLESLESSVGTLLIEHVAISAIVNNSVTSVSEIADAKKIWFDVSIAVERVAGDAGRLEQVLINLLSNAIGHSASGCPVIVVIAPRSDMIRFSIHDNGSGVPDTEKLSIFERFSQGRSKGAGSFGLGLAICKEIIRQHGGTIGCADSQVGRGSEFWFELPCGLE